MQSSQRKEEYLTGLANTKIAQMSREDRKSLKDSQGHITIVEMPDLAQVMEMRQPELLKNLHRCPASQYFGNFRAMQTFSFKQARKLVIEMIRSHAFLDLDVIPEFSSKEEKGSQLNASIRSIQV